MAELTPLEKHFCELYARTSNATEAYLETHPKVSYKTANVNGTRWLKRPELAAYVHELAQSVTDENIADLKECLILLTEVMRTADEQTKNKLKAADMRLKTLGAYIDKKDINVNSETKINVTIDEDEE